MEHTFVRPTQALPYKTQHDNERFRIAFMATCLKTSGTKNIYNQKIWSLDNGVGMSSNNNN